MVTNAQISIDPRQCYCFFGAPVLYVTVKPASRFLKHKENIILSFDWKTEPAVINNQNLRLTSEPDFWVLFSMVSTFSPTLMF